METGLDQEITALKDMAQDPTLESCCQRDLEEQIRHISLKSALDASDRSQERQRVIDNVFIRSSSQSRTLLDEEDNEEKHLEKWRAERLRELQKRAEQKAGLLLEGYGTLLTVYEEDLQVIMKKPHHRTVCHFVAAGSTYADVIDEALDGLARVYVGCLFLRCIAEQQSPWPQASRVSLKSGLVCLEKGKIIGRYLLDEKMKVDLEESISIWLHDCGCRKEWQVEEEEETDEANSFNAMSSGKQGFLSSRNETPGCDICGRNYPHEHVRALQPEGFI